MSVTNCTESQEKGRIIDRHHATTAYMLCHLQVACPDRNATVAQPTWYETYSIDS